MKLLLFGLSPAVSNIAVTVLTFVYVFGLVAVMDFCVSRFKLPQDISRKITHIGAGTLIAFWALYTDADWTMYLNVFIFAVWIVLLTLKGLTADENDDAVKTMTRTGDRRELLRGPLYFVIVAAVCGTLYYKTFEGIMAMAALGWGDGVAPMIGSRYGRLKYTVLSPKSVEGSLSVFVASVAAGCFFVWLILPQSFALGRIVALSAVATVAEGLSPRDLDNFLIPIAVIGAAQFIV